MSGGAYNFRSVRLSLEVNYYYMMQKSDGESVLKRIIAVDEVGRYTREKSVAVSKSLEQSHTSDTSQMLCFDFDDDVPQKVGGEKALYMGDYSG